MTNSERTFIMIKPDAVQRGLVGNIMKRFEQKGLKLVGLKFHLATVSLLEEHYADLSKKTFFPSLVRYMASGPVLAMVWEGQGVVDTGRKLLGETNPADSSPGTIRGDFCVEIGRNICHGSDSVDSAKKEINLWFKKEELVTWRPATRNWLYEEEGGMMLEEEEEVMERKTSGCAAATSIVNTIVEGLPAGVGRMGIN